MASNQHQVQSARAWAVECHGGQQYAGGPYVNHLDEVQSIVCQETDDTGARVSAYLHDVVEDTEATVRDVRNRFGRRVAFTVALLTDSPGKNRRERKAATYAALRSASDWRAKVVKLADRLANLRQCLRDLESTDGDRARGRSLAKMYVNEHDDLVGACSGVSAYLQCEVELATERLRRHLGAPT